jgi:type II secretory pathway pseudopilin PulG
VHPTQRSQAGLTLIELISVILTLGVIVAAALPHYTRQQSQARQAQGKAMLGAFKAAAAVAKAAAMSNSALCAAAAGVVVIDGLPVALNYCYPQALGRFGSGILGAANMASSDGWVIDADQPGSSAPNSRLVIQLATAVTPAECAVSYTSAADAATPPVAAAELGGC